MEYAIGQFGHICVSLFAFITGCGMFFSYEKGCIIKKSFKKGYSFLICYRLVLFGIAIPVNLALGKMDITPRLVLQNMFAYDHSLVSFAWYVRFYLAMLITLHIFYKAMTKRVWVTVPVFLILPAAANYFLEGFQAETLLSAKRFIHSIFFFRTAELMKYAYAPKISVLIVAWVILISLTLSVMLMAVSDLVLKRGRKETNKQAPPKSKDLIKRKENAESTYCRD